MRSAHLNPLIGRNPSKNCMSFIDATATRSDAFWSTLTAVENSGGLLVVAIDRSTEAVDRALNVISRFPATVIALVGTGEYETAHASDRVPTIATASLVLRELSKRVCSMPPAARVAVCHLWASVSGRLALAEIVDGLGVSRRTIDRSLCHAGLLSLATQQRCARVASSWDILGDGRVGIRYASTSGGFASERAMTLSFRAMLGTSPRAAQRYMTTSAVVVRIASCCRVD